MSGLALAHQLADQNDLAPAKAKVAAVIEPRTRYSQDKTWCYWQQQPCPFDAAITHRWHQWRIAFQGQSCIAGSQQTPYVRVDSARYYDIAEARLAASDSVSLHLGQQITGLSPQSSKRDQTVNSPVLLELDTGQFTANIACDTRPADIPADTLLQHFAGWEISVDSDVFDPETVTLMDFQPAAADDIHFFYVLPFDRRSALVETTHFSKSLLTKDGYANELTTYLREQLGVHSWRIQRQEQGVIPMPKRGPDLTQRPHAQIIPLGLHADTVKPSTGYCYPHAQQQAAGLAQDLFSGNAHSSVTVARNKLARWFDGVFITFLERHPQRAGEIFLALFQRVPADALVRFLSDRARPTDYLRVIAALPKSLFISAAARYARGA